MSNPPLAVERNSRLWNTRTANCDTSSVFPVSDLSHEEMRMTMRSPAFVIEIPCAALMKDALSLSHFRNDLDRGDEVDALKYILPVFFEFVARCFGRLDKDYQSRKDDLQITVDDETADKEIRDCAAQKINEFEHLYFSGDILNYLKETLQDSEEKIYGYRFWLLNRFMMVNTNLVWNEMLNEATAQSQKLKMPISARGDQWRLNLTDRTTYIKYAICLNNVAQDNTASVTLDTFSNPRSPAHPNRSFAWPQLVLRQNLGGAELHAMQKNAAKYWIDDFSTFSPLPVKQFYRIDASEAQSPLGLKLLPHVQVEMAMADTALWFLSFDVNENADDKDEKTVDMDRGDDEDDLLSLREDKDAMEDMLNRNSFRLWDIDEEPALKKRKQEPEIRLNFINGGDYANESQRKMDPYKPLNQQAEILMAGVRAFGNMPAQAADVNDRQVLTVNDRQVLTRTLYVLCRNRMWRMYKVLARHSENIAMSESMKAIHTARMEQGLYAQKHVFTIQQYDSTMPLFCNWEGKRLVEHYVIFQSSVPCLLDLVLKYRFDAFNADETRVHQHLIQQSLRGGAGKSFLLKTVGVWCSIPGTAFALAYMSDKCWADPSRNQNDMAIYNHECKESTLFNSDDEAHKLLKTMLSENTFSHSVLVIDPPPRKTVISNVPMVCVWFGCRNEKRGAPKVMSDALSSRFDIRQFRERSGDVLRLINLYLKDVMMGSTQQQQVKDEAAEKHRMLQGLVAEVEKCIASGVVCDVSIHLAGVFFEFVLRNLANLYPGKQSVRYVERAVTHARCNALMDAVAKTWMYEGAPLHGEDIDLERGMPFLERFLYVGVEHCIAAFGDLLGMFFDASILSFANAMSELKKPNAYRDAKILQLPNFDRQSEYIWFYTKKGMEQTLLDIILNTTGKESATPITSEHFETLFTSALTIDIPAMANTTYNAPTVTIPLFRTFIVDVTAIRQLTDSNSGEIHGIAARFGEVWGRNPAHIADDIVGKFLAHSHQFRRKYTFRPNESVVYTKTTISTQGPKDDATVFKLPGGNSVQKSMLEVLPESEYLLKKSMSNDDEIPMDFDSWALLQHNKQLQISRSSKIPRAGVLTTQFMERAFKDLRDEISLRNSSDETRDNIDDDDNTYFAGQSLKLYLSAVKKRRPVWQYKLLYKSVSRQIQSASIIDHGVDCYDFPKSLLFNEKTNKYVWEEKEFEQLQIHVSRMSDLQERSDSEPVFYVVDDSAEQNLVRAALDSNARCMKTLYPHTIIYPLILDVRKRWYSDGGISSPSKSYPEEWMDLNKGDSTDQNQDAADDDDDDDEYDEYEKNLNDGEFTSNMQDISLE